MNWPRTFFFQQWSVALWQTTVIEAYSERLALLVPTLPTLLAIWVGTVVNAVAEAIQNPGLD